MSINDFGIVRIGTRCAKLREWRTASRYCDLRARGRTYVRMGPRSPLKVIGESVMNAAKNLESSYAGLAIQSPVVIGSCPLTLETSRVIEFAEAGAGAVVMPSIFEEQISRDQMEFVAYPPLHIASGETLSISSPDLDRYNGGTDQYLQTIERHKASCSVPIIASINCVSGDCWAEYGQRLAAAGADAIEVNLFHYEVDPERFAEDVERELLTRIRYAVEATGLPLPHWKQFWKETKTPNSGKGCQQVTMQWTTHRHAVLQCN